MNWFFSSGNSYAEGERLFAAGEFSQAESCFAKAATELETWSASPLRRGSVLLALARTQWKLDKPVEARQNAGSARELLSGKAKPTFDLANCLDLLASIQEKEGDLAGAAKLFREAVDIHSKAAPREAKLLTERLRHLAEILSKNNERDEAEQVLARALAVAEERLGTRDPITADCLLDLGVCRLKPENCDDALALMERALDIHREALGPTADEVARVLQKMGGACHKAGHLEKAVNYYEMALNGRERQVGGDSTGVASLLVEMADAYAHLGSDAPAVEMLQQAVGKLAGSSDPMLGRALEGIAGLYGQWGRLEDAASYYLKARTVWENDPGRHEDALRINGEFLEGLGYDGVSLGSVARGDRPSSPNKRPPTRGSSAFTSFYNRPLEVEVLEGAKVESSQPPASKQSPSPKTPRRPRATGAHAQDPPSGNVRPDARSIPTYPLPAVLLPAGAGMYPSAVTGGGSAVFYPEPFHGTASPAHGEAVAFSPPLGRIPAAAGYSGEPALRTADAGGTPPVSQRVSVTFVNPDGLSVAPAEAGTGAPIHLTLFVPESGVPAGPVTARVSSAPSHPGTRPIAPRQSGVEQSPPLEGMIRGRGPASGPLNGWDDLGFDSLSFLQPAS